jgi:hypothetical protein
MLMEQSQCLNFKTPQKETLKKAGVSIPNES